MVGQGIPEIGKAGGGGGRGQDTGGGRGGPAPPWNLQSLISPILLEMKKLVIFYICALPQLYVKVGPPLEKFSGSALDSTIYGCVSDIILVSQYIAIFKIVQ